MTTFELYRRATGSGDLGTPVPRPNIVMRNVEAGGASHGKIGVGVQVENFGAAGGYFQLVLTGSYTIGEGTENTGQLTFAPQDPIYLGAGAVRTEYVSSYSFTTAATYGTAKVEVTLKSDNPDQYSRRNINWVYPGMGEA